MLAASPFLTALSTLQKPLLAAVNGAAIGVGTPMLAHCDLIVAARSARCRHAVHPAWPGARGRSSLLFPTIAGHQRASAMLLLGDALDADAALAAASSTRSRRCRTDERSAYPGRPLAALPPQAIRQTKYLMHGQPDLPGSDRRRTGIVSASAFHSPEAARPSLHSWRSAPRILPFS